MCCETLCPQWLQCKNKTPIFGTMVTVKVSMSLTLLSFERAFLLEYACQFEVSKVIANFKADNRQTYKQTDRQITDQKQYAPDQETYTLMIESQIK